MAAFDSSNVNKLVARPSGGWLVEKKSSCHTMLIPLRDCACVQILLRTLMTRNTKNLCEYSGMSKMRRRQPVTISVPLLLLFSTWGR